MKKLMLFFAVGSMFLTGCTEDDSLVLLGDQEKADLLFLREEEKLARDVYIYSYNKYGHIVFSNISNSEQTHMTSVGSLMDKYGLTDPVGDKGAGVFENDDLQTLYNQLISKSDLSLDKALEVGATIEDLDINDIRTFRSHTTNADLIDVYDRLSCGSRNHIRSFVGQLGTYSPSFISQSEYDAILNSSNERCGY